MSYNTIVGNYGKDLEAKETYYQENGVRLDVGEIGIVIIILYALKLKPVILNSL